MEQKQMGWGQKLRKEGNKQGFKGQECIGWSGNMRKLKQRQKSLSPLENFEFSSVALNFWTFLLRHPRTERVQKHTASETLNN